MGVGVRVAVLVMGAVVLAAAGGALVGLDVWAGWLLVGLAPLLLLTAAIVAGVAWGLEAYRVREGALDDAPDLRR